MKKSLIGRLFKTRIFASEVKNMAEENLTRINKFLSEAGYCSRREADKLLDQGRITLNGKVPELGTKVAPGDEVRVDGKLISEARKKEPDVTWLLISRWELCVLPIPGLKRIILLIT